MNLFAAVLLILLLLVFFLVFGRLLFCRGILWDVDVGWGICGGWCWATGNSVPGDG